MYPTVFRGLILIAVVLVTVVAGRWSVRQFLAESLIAWGGDEASREEAVRYAPESPAVIGARGKYLFYRAEPPREEEGIAALRVAAGLAPADYRYRLEMGRAYEQSGRMAEALAATRQAVELAPRYFETHWALANLRLRAGATEEALREFRVALELSEGRPGRTNGRAAVNVYDAVAQSLGLDLAALRQVAPPDVTAQSWLGWYLASHGALDQALEIFRDLPPSEDNGYPELIFQLLASSQAANRYAEGRQVWERLGRLAGVSGATDGNLIWNGGFEQTPLSERYPNLLASALGFDWLIGRHPQIVVRRDDAQAHSGRRSLHLEFSRSMESPFEQVSVIAVVEPLRRYTLRFRARAIGLPSEPPWIEIADARGADIFALRVPVPRDGDAWQERSIGFTTPAESHGLRLTLRSPAYRGLSPLDRGDLWLDDFELFPTPSTGTEGGLND